MILKRNDPHDPFIRDMIMHSGRRQFLLTVEGVGPTGELECKLQPYPPLSAIEPEWFVLKERS